ncbi:hypothetical protein E2C01_018296 [Portunus trituberculatus]|uniref:HTH psq-type domain-containing protein n=1 Tax=Portunus trituberculatus TaxID=210409 RepID=A0A5B7DW11_PORTR|nr:hypothetical protein [Portunus trituberculatus]
MSGRRSNAVEKVKATEAVVMSEEIEIENECEMLDGQETIEPVEHMITETENETAEISENGQVVEEKKVLSVSGSGRRRRRKQAVKSGNTDPVMNENILENEKPGESDDLESYDKVQVGEKSVTIDNVQDEDITIQTVKEIIPKDQEEETIVKVATKKAEVKEESKEATEESKTKEEKQIQPRTLRATLAKVPPTLAAGGGVGSVRMLGGGVRGTNMPLIVSMGAGNPAIPLLPAGLPPGRYVILPGSSTTTTKTSTVTTMSSSMTPRLATSVATSGTQGLVAAQKTLAAAPLAPPTTPPATVGEKIYTRERGRRKSYTAGEKLAMIRAVEGGQRKSAVADRFGVAPSTLASILAQKHKIRSEQDNLTRRRVRRYHLKDDAASRTRVVGAHSSTSTMRLNPSSDHPFTHFLAPLSAPTPAVLDTQPEDIVAGKPKICDFSATTASRSEVIIVGVER